ncbi:ABC transporter permease [Candidatus Phytoplasma sacchari]|uniref:ABC transporter permease n=1 Tax=Candidatus Phytoplasma sacchari TaxID=2609813 RepID=A0ABY7M0G6_9MOLU|nr:ABC transporter permease [Candidatus Phytoplasma sacchari]
MLLKYILKKILYSFLICLIIAIVIFVVMRKFSDPALALLGHKSTDQQINKLKKELELDKPFVIQFKNFISRIFLKFDFGNSYIRRDISSLKLFLPAFLVTLKISLISCIISSIIGIGLSFISAFYRNSKKDYFLILISIIIISIPSFSIGFFLQYVLGFKLEIFPISGMSHPLSLFLPITSLVLMSTFIIFRISRNSINNVLEQPYILTARAKGLSEFSILLKHVLKNAIIPVVTNIILILSFMLSGSIITETIFNINGLGNLIISSFKNRDLPVIQCSIIFLSFFISIVNIIMDLLYFYLDPTIRKI